RHRGGAEPRLRERRSVEGRVHRHGEGAARWVGLGPAELLTARTAPDESMGGRSCACAGGGTPILALDMYEHSYQRDYGAAAVTSTHGEHRLGTRRTASAGSRARRA